MGRMMQESGAVVVPNWLAMAEVTIGADGGAEDDGGQVEGAEAGAADDGRERRRTGPARNGGTQAVAARKPSS